MCEVQDQNVYSMFQTANKQVSKQTNKQKNKKLSNKTNQVRIQVTLIYEHSCSVDESAGCKNLQMKVTKEMKCS